MLSRSSRACQSHPSPIPPRTRGLAPGCSQATAAPSLLAGFLSTHRLGVSLVATEWEKNIHFTHEKFSHTLFIRGKVSLDEAKGRLTVEYAQRLSKVLNQFTLHSKCRRVVSAPDPHQNLRMSDFEFSVW